MSAPLAADADNQARIAGWLATPAAHGGQGVELRETHLSWVFLVGERAYKLKKPVRFPFVDFSTPAQRLAACREELRLGRRLAADVYLGLQAVVAAGESFRLADEADADDALAWLVVMRRLDDRDTLEHQLRTAALAPDRLDALADRLADFYRQAPPAPLSAAAYRAAVERHMRENFAELLARAPDEWSPLIRRVHSRQLQRLLLESELFDRRVAAGRIVEGHGDLRPDHVYFTPAPLVIDAVEFNAEYRTLDAVDELCFLAMECERWGRPDVGRRLLERFDERLGDRPPPRLVACYTSYRACVRAKVSLLRAAQCTGAERAAAEQTCRDYLAVADREAALCGPPLVVLTRGVSGTGKSTIARNLAEWLALERLSSDEQRRARQGAGGDAAAQAERYRPEQRARVYDDLLARADDLLADGQSLVIDATFLSAARRRQAYDLAQRRGARFVALHCVCPAGAARERIAARLAAGSDPSEAPPGLPERQAAEEEPDDAAVVRLTHRVDTRGSVAESLAAARAALCEPAG